MEWPIPRLKVDAVEIVDKVAEYGLLTITLWISILLFKFCTDIELLRLPTSVNRRFVIYVMLRRLRKEEQQFVYSPVTGIWKPPYILECGGVGLRYCDPCCGLETATKSLSSNVRVSGG